MTLSDSKDDKLKNFTFEDEAAAYNLTAQKNPIDGGDEEDESSCPNKRTHFYEFKEYDTVIKLIDSLPTNIKTLTLQEKSFEKFLFICDSYQEQPHLIDPFLLEIFDKLISLVKLSISDSKNELSDEIINEAFKYMYSLTKMRGYKKIVQHLPHEICDFEPVLTLLARQDIKDTSTWHTRYMLLLWLSIVCMIPFDLQRFDANDDKNETILKRFLKICTPYLFATDKCQDACAFLLAKFMSRIDLKDLILPEFFTQLFSYIKEAKINDDTNKLLGSLKCLANIYKYGKREDLLPYTLPTLKCVVEQDFLVSNQLSLIRKFHTKIVQRIGMAFFRSKVAKWRYERGSRVLTNTISSSNVNDTSKHNLNGKNDDVDDENEQVPNEIEEIIEQLLFGLKDKDTIVRWSSAKGIGRITNRLSKDMAEDILTSVLDMFTFENDSAWHGGCLSIAELGRRGLLLPQQLHFVVPIVLKALVFDKKLGNYSLGRNVRDAACYVCWSLARAFEPKIIQPYVNKIAGTLLIVSVFDREVNCRRAASAAFQEHVGRQGQFPHGIDILTKCDYYAVGQLQNCYLNLSVFIAEFNEYRTQLIDHLLEHKFNHWDQSIRELTSQALFKLSPCSSDYMAYNVLPKLLKYSFSIDLNTRHGALISLGELIHSLCNQSFESLNEPKRIENFNKYFNENFVNELKSVICKIFDEKYFKGSGVEYMRLGVCFFIKKLAISRLFQKNELSSFELDELFFKQCQVFLSQCLEYNKESVQQAAVEALKFYCDLNYLRNESTSKILIKESQLIQTYIHNLRSTSKEFVRSGYCLALGNMPSYLLYNKENTVSNFTVILNILIISSKWHSGPIKIENFYSVDVSAANTTTTLNKISGDADSGWVDARKDSIKALCNILRLIKTKQDLEDFGITEEKINQLFECFFHGIKDYSKNSKGDSGSRVREISIEGLESLIELCAKFNLSSFVKNDQLLVRIIGSIAQQAVERIDRQRTIAGRVFEKVIYNDYLNLDHLNFILNIRDIFKKSSCQLMDWNLPQVTLPLFSKLFNIEELQIYLLTGFIYSIGSLTESLVKPAVSSFLKQLQILRLNKDTKPIFKQIIGKILQMCKVELKSDRLSSSLVKAVDLIIQNDFLTDESLNDFNYPLEFLNLFLENVKTTKDVSKLISYIDLFCDMLQFEKDRIRERSMIQLMIMLCHQFPVIRKNTASKLFETLINYPEVFDSQEENDECVQLLTDTIWDLSVNQLRPIRNRLCDLTKTPKPILKTQLDTVKITS